MLQQRKTANLPAEVNSSQECYWTIMCLHSPFRLRILSYILYIHWIWKETAIASLYRTQPYIFIFFLLFLTGQVGQGVVCVVYKYSYSYDCGHMRSLLSLFPFNRLNTNAVIKKWSLLILRLPVQLKITISNAIRNVFGQSLLTRRCGWLSLNKYSNKSYCRHDLCTGDEMGRENLKTVGKEDVIIL